MYTELLYIKSVEHKTLDSGSELWEAWCQDIRTTKDGKEFTALTLTATFWGSTKPCEEGEFKMISGDLTQDSWKDKNTQEWKNKNVIKGARILNITTGEDITPKKKMEDTEEIPF
jgi:hypothetical protein